MPDPRRRYRSAHGNTLYAEFQTGVQSHNLNIDFSKPDFKEFYDLDTDPWEMNNLWVVWPRTDLYQCVCLAPPSAGRALTPGRFLGTAPPSTAASVDLWAADLCGLLIKDAGSRRWPPLHGLAADATKL